MTHTRLFRTLFLLLIAPALLAVNVSVARSAPLLKAYVAASTGKDTNPCTLQSPCESISKALTVISDVGIVTIIENGEYSYFTITYVGRSRFIKCMKFCQREA